MFYQSTYNVLIIFISDSVPTCFSPFCIYHLYNNIRSNQDSVLKINARYIFFSSEKRIFILKGKKKTFERI